MLKVCSALTQGTEDIDVKSDNEDDDPKQVDRHWPDTYLRSTRGNQLLRTMKPAVFANVLKLTTCVHSFGEEADRSGRCSPLLLCLLHAGACVVCCCASTSG